MAEIGVLQQALFDEACAAIAAGDVEAALVVGGEARHRERLAAKLGVEATTSDLGDALPDRVLKPSRSFAPEQEGERGPDAAGGRLRADRIGAAPRRETDGRRRIATRWRACGRA